MKSSSQTMITYWEGVRRGLRGLIKFSGSSGRKEYFSFLSFLILTVVILFVLTFIWFDVDEQQAKSIVEGYFWSFALLSLSATYRRFQDIEKPGVLAFVIPASFYFTIIIKSNPFEYSELIYYLCIGITTYCIVLLMQKSKIRD